MFFLVPFKSTQPCTCFEAWFTKLCRLVLMITTSNLVTHCIDPQTTYEILEPSITMGFIEVDITTNNTRSHLNILACQVSTTIWNPPTWWVSPTLEGKIQVLSKSKVNKICSRFLDRVLTTTNTLVPWVYVTCHLGYKVSSTTFTIGVFSWQILILVLV